MHYVDTTLIQLNSFIKKNKLLGRLVLAPHFFFLFFYKKNPLFPLDLTQHFFNGEVCLAGWSLEILGTNTCGAWPIELHDIPPSHIDCIYFGPSPSFESYNHYGLPALY